jgi:hypothetical protein
MGRPRNSASKDELEEAGHDEQTDQKNDADDPEEYFHCVFSFPIQTERRRQSSA